LETLNQNISREKFIGNIRWKNYLETIVEKNDLIQRKLVRFPIILIVQNLKIINIICELAVNS